MYNRLITFATARRFFHVVEIRPFRDASRRDILTATSVSRGRRPGRRRRKSGNAVALGDCCGHTGASVAAALAIIRSYSHLAKCTFTSRRISGCARLCEAFSVSLADVARFVGISSSDYDYVLPNASRDTLLQFYAVKFTHLDI